MPLLKPRLIHNILLKIEKNKKFFIFISIILIFVIIFIITKPLTDRLRDNYERGEVARAFIQLKGAIDNDPSSDNEPLSIEKARQIAADNTSFSALRHPHNKRPYEIKYFNEEDIINGPGGRKFINYEIMDGTSFYIGNGTCDSPIKEGGNSVFIAYSVGLRRVNENSGRCMEL